MVNNKPFPTLLHCVQKDVFLDRQRCFSVFIVILYIFFIFKFVTDVVALRCRSVRWLPPWEGNGHFDLYDEYIYLFML